MMGAGLVVRSRLDAAAMVAGLALLGLCGLVADDGRVPAPERTVFSWINGLPNGLSAPAHAVQYLGVLAVGPIVAVIALAARRPRLAAAALIVAGLQLLAAPVVWHVVARQR